MKSTNQLVIPYFHNFPRIHEKKHEYKARLIESGLTPADVSLIRAMESFNPPLRRDRSPPSSHDELKLRGRHLFGITLKPSKLAVLSQELRSVQSQLRDMYMTLKEAHGNVDAEFNEKEDAVAARLRVVYDEVQELKKNMRDVDPFGGVKIGGGKGGMKEMVNVVTEEKKLKEGKVAVDKEGGVNEKMCQEKGVEVEGLTVAGEAGTAEAETLAGIVEKVVFVEKGVAEVIFGEEIFVGEEHVLAEALAGLKVV